MKYLKIFENFNNDFYVIYNRDRIVYHTTSQSCGKIININGFKTGEELNVCEKRKAIYFSDKDVNVGIYARNDEGEAYECEDMIQIPINIKGLKLLNLNYKDKSGQYINHKLYNNYVVRGELNKIPLDIDGTISFLNDGKIFEVCLSKETANKIFKTNENFNDDIEFYTDEYTNYQKCKYKKYDYILLNNKDKGIITSVLDCSFPYSITFSDGKTIAANDDDDIIRKLNKKEIIEFKNDQAIYKNIQDFNL